jgi:hypothetical protein
MVKVHLPSSVQDGIKIELIQPQTPPPSWSSLAKLFFTDLFATPVEMCQNVFVHVVERGPVGTLQGFCQILRKHPIDTVSLVASISLSLDPTIAQNVLVPVALTTTRAVRNSQMFIDMAKAFDDKTSIGSGIKLGCYAVVVYFAIDFVCSVPGAAGYEWNALVEAKEAYSGDVCDAPLSHNIRNVVQCLLDRHPFKLCHQFKTDDLELDHQEFTQHQSGALSSVEFKGEKVCFLTAQDPQGPVTKTCFPKITDYKDRITELVPNLTLERARDGLAQGTTVIHVAMGKILNEAELMYEQVRALSKFFQLNDIGNWRPAPSRCGTFIETASTTNLPNHAVCLLTALDRNGPVTQTCFNPDNPSQVVVKPIEGIEMDFPDDKPVSLFIKNPKLLGLNPSADSSSDGSKECDCTCE